VQHIKNEWDASLIITERVYGSHAAFEKRLDRAVLSTMQRAPGMQSSHALLDSYLGRDAKVAVEDVLNGASPPRGRAGARRGPRVVVACRPHRQRPKFDISPLPLPPILSFPHAVPELRPNIPKLGPHDQFEIKAGLFTS
jgi:hypothetical protein